MCGQTQAHALLKRFSFSSPSDIFSHYGSQACTSSRIPYRIVGGLKFFDRAEIKDIVAYLVCIHNNKDTHAFQRAIKAPRRGFGPKLLAQVEEIFSSKNTDYISAALEAAPMRAQSFVDTIKTAAALSKTDVSAAIKHIVTSIKYEEYLKKTAEDSWQDKWENVEVCSMFTYVDNR